jgi:hypothetical protein
MRITKIGDFYLFNVGVKKWFIFINILIF